MESELPWKSSRTLSDQLHEIGMDALSHHILNQHDQNKLRQKFPDALRIFPFTVSKKLQNLFLKIIQLLFKDQRTFNSKVTVTFEQTLNLQKLLRNELHSLRIEMEELKVKLNDHQKSVNETLQQLISTEHAQRISSVLFQNELAQYRHLLQKMTNVSDSSPKTNQPNLRKDLEPIYYELAKTPYKRELRQESLKHLIPYFTKGNSERILDLGSGQGEWLELLKKNHFNAQGVESNSLFTQLCKSFHLDVTCGDALEVIKTIPAQSQNAVTALQFIEHLSIPDLTQILDETLRVLTSKGMLLIETLNPKNLENTTHQFWNDPRLTRLIPQELLIKLMELKGFINIEVVDQKQNFEWDQLPSSPLGDKIKELLGSSHSYFVIGYRP